MKTYKHDEQEIAKTLKDWRARIINPEAEITEMTTRTGQQNKSLYKWERQLAEKLNDGGIPFGDVVIKLPREFTQENIHALIVHPLMNALYPDKTSTAQLTTTEIQDVWMRADKVINERCGVTVDWPSDESLSEEQREA